MLVGKKQKQESIELLLSNLEVYTKHETHSLSLIKEKNGDPLACIRIN